MCYRSTLGVLRNLRNLRSFWNLRLVTVGVWGDLWNADSTDASKSYFEGIEEIIKGLQREDDGRVLVHTDLDQRLQIAQLERGRLLGDQRRSVSQRLRRLILALRQQHTRALLALGLGLAGHRALHGRRQLHVLDLHGGDLDAPALGVLVNDRLHSAVDALALGEQF